MTVYDDPLADTPAYGAAAYAAEQGRFQADARLFDLSGPVGIEQANRRADVFKLQTLLYREGYLDAAGPADGWGGDWTGRDDYALRRFQRDNGLIIDGVALPEGETISAFRDFYAALAASPANGSVGNSLPTQSRAA
jgi:hypothetical protein